MGGATISLNMANFITIGLIAMLFSWLVRYVQEKVLK